MALFDVAGPVAGPHGPLRLFLKQADVTFVTPIPKKARNRLQSYWPKTGPKHGGTPVSLRSIDTYGRKVRLMFAYYPTSIAKQGEIINSYSPQQ